MGHKRKWGNQSIVNGEGKRGEKEKPGGAFLVLGTRPIAQKRIAHPGLSFAKINIINFYSLRSTTFLSG